MIMIMQFEDNNPEEFLFGKLPDKKDNIDISNLKIENKSQLDFLIILSGLVYGLVAILFVRYFFTIETLELDQINSLAFIGGSLFLLSILATFKNYIQLQRCGPFLKSVTIFSTRYMVFQSFISSILLGVIFISSYFLFTSLGLLPQLALIIFLAFIGFFVYARVASNLPLITAGLGIGLLPSYGGIKNSIENLKILYRIMGKKDYHLASLRILFWCFIVSSYQFSNTLVIQGILLVLFTGIYTIWERENGFSISLQIWNIIQNMSPASLPEINFNQSVSLIMSQDSKQVRTSNRSSYLIGSLEKNLKRKDEKTARIPTKQELTPIAARSINRIASSILNES